MGSGWSAALALSAVVRRHAFAESSPSLADERFHLSFGAASYLEPCWDVVAAVASSDFDQASESFLQPKVFESSDEDWRSSEGIVQALSTLAEGSCLGAAFYTASCC